MNNSNQKPGVESGSNLGYSSLIKIDVPNYDLLAHAFNCGDKYTKEHSSDIKSNKTKGRGGCLPAQQQSTGRGRP